MGGAINQCASILQANGNADRQVIDLSTDGRPTTGPDAAQAATSAKDAGIEIWTLGVGSGADNDFLANRVAGCPPTAPNCGARNFPVETFQQFGDAIRTKTQTIIAGTNQPPVAVDDTATTQQGVAVTIPVLDNDSDPDGDPLTITNHTQATNGSVSCTATQCTYTPNAGFTGTDSFTYTVSDGRGGTDTARVTITVVTQLNRPPDAVDDPVITAVNTPITIDVTNNDSDPDGDAIRVTRIVTPPVHGSAQLRADGTIRYVPNPGFLGIDAFTYEICDDGDPVMCDTATVTVEVSIGGGVGIPLLPPWGYGVLILGFAALLLREVRRRTLRLRTP